VFRVISPRRYLYDLIARYVSYVAPTDARVLEVGARSRFLKDALRRHAVKEYRPWPDADFRADEVSPTFDDAAQLRPDHILLSGTFHAEQDIQAHLDEVYRLTTPSTRVVGIYYSSLWRPLFGVADALGLRRAPRDENWVAPSDVENLLALAHFEIVTSQARVLLPIWIPLLSDLINRWLAPLPGIRALALLHVVVARPLKPAWDTAPSVSVVIPARNEAGNIEAAVKRLPAMGPDDEIIFVEGHSTDDTWTRIQQVAAAFPNRRIKTLQQTGRGKGDAVRAGFAVASREILMILDADLTVPPEDLPKFYRARVSGICEFVNGSRLVYPMEAGAMKFANMIGNKFFALAFSFLLGQPFKDTLCGTKVIDREWYERLATGRAYFGDFDPFGDFDLLFGAQRLGLRIRELPVRYRDRTYGATNIQRWRHGVILLRMTMFAARRVKFI
jgi:hypothetical protein